MAPAIAREALYCTDKALYIVRNNFRGKESLSFLLQIFLG